MRYLIIYLVMSSKARMEAALDIALRRRLVSRAPAGAVAPAPIGLHNEEKDQVARANACNDVATGFLIMAWRGRAFRRAFRASLLRVSVGFDGKAREAAKRRRVIELGKMPPFLFGSGGGRDRAPAPAAPGRGPPHHLARRGTLDRNARRSPHAPPT